MKALIWPDVVKGTARSWLHAACPALVVLALATTRANAQLLAAERLAAPVPSTVHAQGCRSEEHRARRVCAGAHAWHEATPRRRRTGGQLASGAAALDRIVRSRRDALQSALRDASRAADSDATYAAELHAPTAFRSIGVQPPCSDVGDAVPKAFDPDRDRKPTLANAPSRPIRRVRDHRPRRRQCGGQLTHSSRRRQDAAKGRYLPRDAGRRLSGAHLTLLAHRPTVARREPSSKAVAHGLAAPVDIR